MGTATKYDQVAQDVLRGVGFDEPDGGEVHNAGLDCDAGVTTRGDVGGSFCLTGPSPGASRRPLPVRER